MYCNSFRSRFLTWILLVCTIPQLGLSKKFYSDDPLWREPPPRQAQDVQPWHLDNLIDFYKNSFHDKGERNNVWKVYPSQGVNTLGEVPDNAWYTNRHWQHRMSEAELAIGPNKTGAPDPSGPWIVTSVKAEGVTPGFSIRDARGRRYLLKFDPPTNPEMATAADVIGAKILYALGYNVPENYIVRFDRSQLQVRPGVKFVNRFGIEQELTDSDLNGLLAPLYHYSDGKVRALASLYISGKPLGGFKYYGRRPDDPNEIAPHEHLRVLRGLYVFCAWLNHTDAKSLNSLDVLAKEDGRTFVKHYLLDFGAAFGSDSLYAKDPRLGHEYFLDWKPGLHQLLTFGFSVPRYARVKYPELPAVGNFASAAFAPEKWKSNYPNAAFSNRLVGDEFWAAKQVVSFSSKDIRAMVHMGEYSDPRAESAISKIMGARADQIGRTFLPKLLPLDNFRVEDNELRFDDLAVKYDLRRPTSYPIAWSPFANGEASRGLDVVQHGSRLPAEALAGSGGAYWIATIRDDERKQSASIYVRKERAGWTVVGVDRDGADRWDGQ